MNIYQKIADIMKNVRYLSKDDNVEFGKTKYKALSEEKVTTIMREEMTKHNLIVYPIRMETNRVGTITHVDVVYRMVNTDNPEEYIDIVSCGDGADTQDKGSGKAMTYAFKYMWLRTFAIPTGEDPDKISSEELDKIQKESEEKKAKEQQANLENMIVSKIKVEALQKRCYDENVKPEVIWKLYNVKSFSELTEKKYRNICDHWQEIKEWKPEEES